MFTQDMGNNESLSRGVCEMNTGDGEKVFVAMTFSQSKYFKTRKGAEKWLARCGYNPDGTRITA